MQRRTTGGIGLGLLGLIAARRAFPNPHSPITSITSWGSPALSFTASGNTMRCNRIAWSGSNPPRILRRFEEKVRSRKDPVAQVEHEYILRCLIKLDGRSVGRNGAAARLGRPRSTLLSWKQLGNKVAREIGNSKES